MAGFGAIAKVDRSASATAPPNPCSAAQRAGACQRFAGLGRLVPGWLLAAARSLARSQGDVKRRARDPRRAWLSPIDSRTARALGGVCEVPVESRPLPRHGWLRRGLEQR